MLHSCLLVGAGHVAFPTGNTKTLNSVGSHSQIHFTHCYKDIDYSSFNYFRRYCAHIVHSLKLKCLIKLPQTDTQKTVALLVFQHRSTGSFLCKYLICYTPVCTVLKGATGYKHTVCCALVRAVKGT